MSSCPGCFRKGVRSRRRVLLQTKDGSRFALVCGECADRGVIVVPALTLCACGKEAATRGQNCVSAAIINSRKEE